QLQYSYCRAGCRPLTVILLPYTTLFRSLGGIARHRLRAGGPSFLGRLDLDGALGALRGFALAASRALALGETRLERLHQVDDLRDRKSTRLNSSHERSSYAVFCLKKKRP